MARNTSKNVYFTVGIPRNSEVLRQLQHDSKETGTSITKLIVVKLADYYKGNRSAITVEEAPIKPQGIEANALAFLDADE